MIGVTSKLIVIRYEVITDVCALNARAESHKCILPMKDMLEIRECYKFGRKSLNVKLELIYSI